MFKEMTLGNRTVKAVTYIYRDPSVDGVRMVRSTLAAILLDDGRLFVGCSTCSESDQFTKERGRTQAMAQATAKASKAVGGDAVMPDALIALAFHEVEDEAVTWKKINSLVKVECLYYQLETYRAFLYNRHVLLEAANEMLAHDCGRVV